MKFFFAVLMFLPLISFSQSQKIEWMTIEEALKAQEKAPKKIVMDVFTDWCGWCKVMDRDTFTDSAVAAYISKNYYAVKMNAEQQKAFVYKGQTFNLLTNGGSSMNQFVLAITNNKPSYPSLAYFTESGDVLTVVPGFRKPGELLLILKYLGEDKYKTTKFEDFTAAESAAGKK